MGLAPILVEQIFDIIKEINAQGTTVLLVEQNALMALASPIAATSSRPARSCWPTSRRPSPRTRRSAPPTSEGTDRPAHDRPAQGQRSRRLGLRPARRPDHRSSSSRPSLIAIVKPWGSPAAPAAVVPPPPPPTASPTARPSSGPDVFDFLTFGTNEPPPGWEIWPAGNLSSFHFAMRIDAVGDPATRRRRPAPDRTSAGSPAARRGAVIVADHPHPGRQLPRPDRPQQPDRVHRAVRHPQTARRRDVRADTRRHRPIPVARPLHDHRLRGGRRRRSRCRPGRPATTASTSPSNPGI